MPGYLDHAATSPLRPAVFEVMVPFLTEHTGNPTGAHSAGRFARKAIEDAREVVADAFCVVAKDVVFTSGGTESNNLAIAGARGEGRVLCSAVEHHAVLEPVAAVGGETIPVDRDGVVDLAALEPMLDESVTFVSVMLANNEVGVVQPLHKVSRLVRKLSPNAVLHTDAVQAAPWLDVARFTQLADLVTVSAHKLGGPMGAGALIIKNDVELKPMLLGGGQEQERRSGTHNVQAIIGFGKAMEMTVDAREATVACVEELRDRLVDELDRKLGLRPTSSADKLPNNVHFCIEGVDNEALIVLLDGDGVHASAGASCSSGALQSSHVLEAMGVAPDLAKGALRLSLGWSTTEADVDLAIKAVVANVESLRESA